MTWQTLTSSAQRPIVLSAVAPFMIHQTRWTVDQPLMRSLHRASKFSHREIVVLPLNHTPLGGQGHSLTAKTIWGLWKCPPPHARMDVVWLGSSSRHRVSYDLVSLPLPNLTFCESSPVGHDKEQLNVLEGYQLDWHEHIAAYWL